MIFEPDIRKPHFPGLRQRPAASRRAGHKAHPHRRRRARTLEEFGLLSVEESSGEELDIPEVGADTTVFQIDAVVKGTPS